MRSARSGLWRSHCLHERCVCLCVTLEVIPRACLILLVFVGWFGVGIRRRSECLSHGYIWAAEQDLLRYRLS